jgi:hypothetical protein
MLQTIPGTWSMVARAVGVRGTDTTPAQSRKLNKRKKKRMIMLSFTEGGWETQLLEACLRTTRRLQIFLKVRSRFTVPFI